MLFTNLEFPRRNDALRNSIFRDMIRKDQLSAVRRIVLISIPVNILLGISITIVAAHSGNLSLGLLWMALSSAVNLSRIILCKSRMPPGPSEAGAMRDSRPWLNIQTIHGHLTWHWILALLSGSVWALIPILSDGYTSPETIFYLVVVCGITAGAVTHGFAYARIPICFITPPLLSVIGCLVYAGGFQRLCLAATVLLYLVALIRAALESEGLVCDSSRLKHEATTMAESLEAANRQATRFAQEMRHRAAHDDLTGLLNRSGFFEQASTQMLGTSTSCCLMLLDLDGFKAVNDALGHTAGDGVLVEVARRLRHNLDETVTVARLGGDEFAVLYMCSERARAPSILAAELIAAIAIPFAAFEAGAIGVSIGICLAAGETINEMTIQADAALYAAKNKGRNRYCVFDEDLRKTLEMRRDVERDLARALGQDALEVWYQPIFGDAGASLSGFEALVRWKHPRHGWIPPADLVAVAALTGLSEPLMRFVLKDVCGMIRTLRALGIGHLRVAMNVSPRELAQLPVDDLVLAKLSKLGIPPQALEIEITEESAMDQSIAQERLSALSGAGVHITIDDFGVGYSSLGSLHQLRVDRVKVDRCFVTGISDSESAQVLMKAILNLGNVMGFEALAEGVESADDLSKLKQLGCSAVQGYYFARPMPHGDAITWVQRFQAQPVA